MKKKIIYLNDWEGVLCLFDISALFAWKVNKMGLLTWGNIVQYKVNRKNMCCFYSNTFVFKIHSSQWNPSFANCQDVHKLHIKWLSKIPLFQCTHIISRFRQYMLRSMIYVPLNVLSKNVLEISSGEVHCYRWKSNF